MQEPLVQSLDQEDPLEEGMATLSSILAWRIPWKEEPGGLQSIGLQRVRHDSASKQHDISQMPDNTEHFMCLFAICFSPLVKHLFTYTYLAGGVLAAARTPRHCAHLVHTRLWCGAWSCGCQPQVLLVTWDLRAQTSDQSRVPCTARQTLNPRTIREVPSN